MSPSSLLLCMLVGSLLLASTAGCHHRSGVPEAPSGIHAAAPTSIGVPTAKPSDFEQAKTARIEDLFAARFAGVQVHRTGTGRPMLHIRGVEPLVVVDGLEGDSHLLLTLRPQEVVRIEVLTDPGSTAIYGNRGLNGVIVITTKRGG